MEIEEEIKVRLLKKAMAICPGKAILPCGNKERLEDCYTRSTCHYIFWFNTPGDCSTKAVFLPIDPTL